MSDDNRFGGAPARPERGNDDYGFFTQSPAAPPSHFGGPPDAPAPATRPAAPYLPPATAVLAIPAQATAPPANEFGPPPSPLAQPWQSGPPPAPGQAYALAPRSGMPAWAIVAICVPVGLIFIGILAAIAIPVFLNQRSTPVMPDTVRGIARTTDPLLTKTTQSIRDGLLRDNPGSKIDVAGYGDMKSGFVVMGANLRMNAAREFGSMGNSVAPPTAFGEIECASSPTSRVSMCLRVGTRGSVDVMAIGGSDLSELATETSKVWSAQPYGK
jgi:hypothetical protein